MALPNYIRNFIFVLTGILLSVTVFAETIKDARLALRTRHYAEAEKILTSLAEQGDSDAQYLLASLYNNSVGVIRNYHKAFTWLELAADQENVDAQYMLGCYFEQGKGTKKDIETALKWFRRASGKGHRQAEEKLEFHLSKGLGDKGSKKELLFQAIRNSDAYHARQYLEDSDLANIVDSDGLSPLQLATEQNSQDVVELLLRNQANPDFQNRYSETALMLSARMNFSRIAQLLISYRANVNLRDNSGNTALHFASRKGFHKIVAQLLDAGAAPNAKNKGGSTPLDMTRDKNTIAVLRKNAAVVSRQSAKSSTVLTNDTLAKNALKQAELAAKEKDHPFHNWPALNIAAWRGQREVVEALLQRGMQVDSLDPQLQTPLSRAATQGHHKIVLRLLLAGANPNHRLPDKTTTIELAVNGGHSDAVSTLINAGASRGVAADHEPLLNQAARKSQEQVALLLLASNAAYDKSFDGSTPLIWTSKNNLSLLLEKLLTKSPDIDARDNSARTALWYAAFEGHTKNVSMLLDAGANSALTDGDNNSPFSIAAREGRDQVAELLVSQGANISEANNHGNTPLMLAAQNGHIKILELILNHGGDYRTRNNNSYTALMLAAQAGQLQAVELLISNGASSRRKNKEGKNTMTIAQEAGYHEISHFLSSF